MEANNLVLLVEDDHDIREVTLQVLQDLEYRPVAAENGQQALNMLRTMDELPCLVLLDLMMPIMNGWQLLDILRSDNRLSQVPVVVMSAVVDFSADTLDVAGYLRKPATYDQVHEILKQNCN